MSAPKCPKCGKQMEFVRWSEWTLNGQRIIDAICPACLHIEHVDVSKDKD